jgi:hypothetical protein
MEMILKWSAHVLFVIGLGIFYILPRNKYDWMHTVDSATTNLPLDQSADSRLIFTATVLFVIVLSQGLLVVKTSKKREKMISLLLILAAAAIWCVRYL